MENKDDLLPHNRNYFLLGGCLTFIFTLVILSLVVQNLQRQEAEKPVIQELSVVEDKNNNNNENNQITRYSQDSDQDGIPNFIEDEAGLNKFESEIYSCEKKTQKCSDPITQKKFYVSFLLDASTSMNLPALEDQSKLENVRQEIIEFMELNELNKNYIVTSIRSFGNTGQRGNIPDSESCVSTLKLSNFEETISPNMFNRYVANGKSPVIFALEQAEMDFTDPNAQNIIFLITDGVDECNPSSLKNAVSGILGRGVVRKINAISVFSSSYNEGIIKDAIESNSGTFQRTSSISESIRSSLTDNIIKNWCAFENQQEINQCIISNYEKALNTMNSKINYQTDQKESSKIREINSSINLTIQNYTTSNNNTIISKGKSLIKFDIKR